MLLGVLAAVVAAPVSAAYASPSAGSLQQQIDAKNNALEKVIEQYNKVTILLQQGRADQAKAQATLDQMQVAVASASADVGQIAAAAYMGGPMNGLNALLAAGSPQAFLDQLTSLNQAALARSKDLVTYQRLNSDLQAEKNKLDQQVAAGQALQNQLAAQKAQINGQITQLKALMAKAGQTGTSGPSAPPKNIPYYPGPAGVAVKFAFSQIGSPYNYAAAGPYSVGYDCSGLTMAAWAKAGVSLPHNADMQYHDTAHVTHISRSQLQPGDLVFYNDLGHVAIYVGGGKVIHAPHTGTTVQEASVDMETPYGYGRPHS